jgi:2-octaprenyl-6-methoxyphenol hydroxylase
MESFDIAIVGGGLVGASLAVALRDSGRRVVLIEAMPPPASEPCWDERCIALNDASVRILGSYGIWSLVAAEAAPITATHISERGRFGVARFTAAEAGLDTLGYNTPLRVLGAALWQKAQKAGSVELLCPAKVEAIVAGDSCVQLQIAPSSGGAASDRATPSADPTAARTGSEGSAITEVRTIGAKLVVAADGARSAVRQLLGLGAETRDYQQSAIVSAVRLSRPHGGVAYERFMPGGPLALIPKGDRACSLVWTRPQDEVESLLGLDDSQYLQRAEEAFGGRLGRFVALGRRWSYPLARVMSDALTAPRVVFVGNAAQSLHPVAAQGFNLGLRDVAALAELLRDSADPGELELLAEYVSRRTQDRERVSGMTDLMVRVFSNRLPVLSQARHWGLVAVDLLPGLRESVMRQHLGHLGLPRAL